MGNLENTTSEEPEYVIFYHAIDWLAGLVDNLSPIYLHSEIEDTIHLNFDNHILETKRSGALNKLNIMLEYDRLTLYAKPFVEIYAQSATSNFNTPNLSLDYPDYIISRTRRFFHALPHYAQNKIERLEYRYPLCTPISFSQIKLNKGINESEPNIFFSFIDLMTEDRNCYALNENKFDTYYELDDIQCINISMPHLFFLRTKELKELFPRRQLDIDTIRATEELYKSATKLKTMEEIANTQQQYINRSLNQIPDTKTAQTESKNTKTSGAPKQYYAEISLLKFLEQSQDKFTPEEKNKFANFLKKLNFEDIIKLNEKSKDKKLKQSLKKMLDDLYEDKNTLNEIIKEIKALGIPIDHILGIAHKSFSHALTDEYGSQRTLQKHFNEINTALDEAKKV